MTSFTDMIHSLETTAEEKIAQLKILFDADVLPYIENFIETFATQEGKVILQAAIADASLLETGNFAAATIAVGTAAVAAAPALAQQDAQKTLLQIQTALQLVKASKGLVAASDPATAAAIVSNAAPAATATDPA